MPNNVPDHMRAKGTALELSRPISSAGETAFPIDPSRRALLIGGFATASGAAIMASGAKSQTVPNPMEGHDMSAMQADPYAAPMPGMAHGNMTMVGLVDHAKNGFDPTAMLTDWETGRTEFLPVA